MMCDLEAAHLCEAGKPKSMKVGGLRHARMSIEGYKLMVGIHEWRFKRGHFCQAGGSIQLQSYCLHQDFGNVDIIGLLPTKPIIPHNYSARYRKIVRHGQM
jgi:hypothetical protein